MDRLRAYTWPGNVRELQSVIKQALLRASGTVLLPAFLPGLDRVADASRSLSDLDAYIRALMTHNTSNVYAETHRHVDRLLLMRALEHTGGNQRDAAQLLGISRQTMRSRMRALGVTVSTAHEIEDEGETPLDRN
jgi:DNA-binding NtrC family response regulator